MECHANSTKSNIVDSRLEEESFRTDLHKVQPQDYLGSIFVLHVEWIAGISIIRHASYMPQQVAVSFELQTTDPNFKSSAHIMYDVVNKPEE
jgi:hypothetical protein